MVFYFPTKTDLVAHAAKLSKACFQLCEASYQFGSPWSQTSFQENMQTDYQFYGFLKLNGRLVGFVSYTKLFAELEITNLAIHRDFQRQGLAWALWQRLLARQTEACRFLLEVRGTNLAAQQLYQKLGFQLLTQRKAYYANPTEDALVMEKYWQGR
ncbi:ribosomal protein S18-alanine N-acetyltransferase [Loigolactobacillus backii]|uniref:[Ribosomal protein bS18]-alanine N-acetyltransferase n=1 Tax=Loigolactobacillus backii TaxID=375175 RepID=A0A192H2Y1_9LACO|nr:ribosomal protein S18-alanine N-acetyltransferase [Loigolactobacillus backii]ANK59175.1 hypothetical protein AYR52_02155 [Loigolactobacillus backii]ANK62587.1 hypothetical protein AYR53_07270 [Loigolactobacillus backii]ANK64165.1 hypothetical protein AYR54_02150 [Loigolactobacillus backii]ANK67440.1 hypothetical protein AYR55_06885 [Loigolactobacillus backii]ANK70402.1 hypothetical protein AYR56_09730 [Loigolactobacillus backii]